MWEWKQQVTGAPRGERKLGHSEDPEGTEKTELQSYGCRLVPPSPSFFLVAPTVCWQYPVKRDSLSEETLQGRLNCWAATKTRTYKFGAEIPREGKAVANGKLVTSATVLWRARSAHRFALCQTLGTVLFLKQPKLILSNLPLLPSRLLRGHSAESQFLPLSR